MKLIVEKYQKILKQKLVGIYLHGSVAFGCCSPKSDLDFVVVISSTLSLKEKKKLIEVLLENNALAPKKGFEMSVVLWKN